MTANMMMVMIMIRMMRMTLDGWMLMRLMMTRMMGSNIMLSRVFLVMTSASKSWSTKPSDDKISLQLRRLRVSSRRMRRDVEVQQKSVPGAHFRRVSACLRYGEKNGTATGAVFVFVYCTPFASIKAWRNCCTSTSVVVTSAVMSGTLMFYNGTTML